MKVRLNIEEKYYGSVKKMLSILLPELDLYRAEQQSEEVDLTVVTNLDTTDGIKVKSYLKEDSKLQDKIEDDEILNTFYDQRSFEKRCKERVKLSIYRLLSKYLNQPLSPWGILIGVRPTKIGHRLLDRGFTYQKIDEIFRDIYALAQEKRKLLLDVIKVERNYLPNQEEAQRRISIYLGVPFCPTRCNYCSFAAYPLQKYNKYLSGFLQALEYEIKTIGEVVNRLGLIVDTIYIGGGTPTVLSASQLDKMLDQLRSYFVTPQLREFTVEAGRADTINRAKLEVLKRNGIDRISINPQTMNQNTLDKIGRCHTVEEVVEAFNLAREIGFNNINMDLIVGLPDEGIDDMEVTLREIERLKPDNLTVHTMAIKRASDLKNNLTKTELASDQEAKKMLQLTKDTASKLDLDPYYMYRQKHILGNLENVGYAKDNTESIYNILMMEERETVLGLGGGAITKFINAKDWSIDRLINPKFPKQYIEEIEIRTAKKIAKLTTLVK